jgi:2-polyprenyl-6-methoxyphenol hydroxylase-like FAD-dependent oxidoreductase
MTSDRVFIVGAGPVGLAAAARLAALGVAPRVVEQLEAPSRLSKAVAVHARTLELFDAMGVIDRFLDQGVRIAHAEMRSGGKVRVRVSFDGIDSRYPFVLDIPQDTTESILSEHLAGLGVTVERGVALAGLAQTADGVDVTLRRADGTTEQDSVAWVVGCDGGHSTVRHLAPTALEGSFHGVRFILADVDADWSVDPEAIGIHLHPGGIAGSFPLGGKRVRLVLEVRDAVASGAEPTLEETQQLTVERIDSTARLSNPRWLTYFEIHHGQVPRYRFGRVLLAGDAAHIHSPAGGQGMNTGLQDAENLAWKLALVARGRAEPALLDSYDAERHPVGASVVKLTSTMTDLGTSSNPAVKVARAVMLTVVGATSLSEKLASEIAEVSIGYPHSPIVSSSLSSRQARHAPRPGLHAPYIEGLDLTRHTAVVVGAGGRPSPDLGVHDPGLAVLAVDGAHPVAQLYGGAETMTVVRPDGYVGLVARTGDDTALGHYFAELLGIADFGA